MPFWGNNNLTHKTVLKKCAIARLFEIGAYNKSLYFYTIGIFQEHFCIHPYNATG
jgi:hypothetical protein